MFNRKYFAHYLKEADILRDVNALYDVQKERLLQEKRFPVGSLWMKIISPFRDFSIHDARIEFGANRFALENIGRMFVHEYEALPLMLVHIEQGLTTMVDRELPLSTHKNSQPCILFHACTVDQRGLAGFILYDVREDGQYQVIEDDSRRPSIFMDVLSDEQVLEDLKNPMARQLRIGVYDRYLVDFYRGAEMGAREVFRDHVAYPYFFEEQI